MKGSLLLALVFCSAAAGAEPAQAWFGAPESGSIVVGDQVVFSFKARQTDPAKVPLIRELAICTPRAERFLLRISRGKSDFSLELGYEPSRRSFEPELVIGPVPTRDAVLPPDPEDPTRVLVPMTTIRAGAETMDFAVPDLGILTVQKWLDEVWRAIPPDMRQVLTDVLLASKFTRIGGDTDLSVLVGLVPREIAKAVSSSPYRKGPAVAGACARGTSDVP